MRSAVANAFTDFTIEHEGYTPYMYADVKNLVTTGIGNLIDPIGAALSLPWKRSDGSPASQDEIRDAWNTVKSHTELNQRGGGSYQGLTTLRLNKQDIKNLVANKVSSNESILRTRFPGFDSWPSDAQLGILSMAWAAGPGFKFPKFQAAASKLPPDFLTMAKESFMPSLGNKSGGRNDNNNLLFTNAAKVLELRADPDRLYFPGNVIKSAAGIGGIVLGVGMLTGAVIGSNYLLRKVWNKKS